MTEEGLTALAFHCAFTAVQELDVATLQFLPEIRAMCAADRCHSYGRSWSCPPACGTLEELREKTARYSRGILLQTVGSREDSFDYKSMIAVGKANREHFDNFVAELRKRNADFFPMSAGACTRCKPCTYPDKPCRFPDRCFPSMEACGLFVSKVCEDNGLPYYYGEEKISYTCLILYE